MVDWSASGRQQVGVTAHSPVIASDDFRAGGEPSEITIALTGDGIALEDHRTSRLYHTSKRVLDILVAGLGLLVLLPLLAVVGIAIRLDSPGPAIFRQERLGGRRKILSDRCWWMVEPFMFLKFRTMRADVEPDLHLEYISAFMQGDHSQMETFRSSSDADHSYKLSGDPRVTRVGKLLRLLSLDELPQLWNVLKGEMSLVGPRPHLSYEVSMYNGNQILRMASLPGITGLSQVRARALAPFETMVDYDIEYVSKHSIWLDIGILIRTIPVVLSRKGAG